MGLLDRIVQLQKKEGFASDISTVGGIRTPKPKLTGNPQLVYASRNNVVEVHASTFAATSELDTFEEYYATSCMHRCRWLAIGSYGIHFSSGIIEIGLSFYLLS